MGNLGKEKNELYSNRGMCSPRTVFITQILVRETLFLLLLLWDGAQIQITMVLQAERQSVEPY